ncbi:MAG TPA: cytochrome c3 family protein [Thermoanaerobaculia bacterium]|nr:cytochrome c3 family protein [Thermoanaerobaculia bacterium]
MIAAIVLWAAVKATTSCIPCHAEDKAKHFATDVHAQVGLSCHDCHGGNPDPKLADDMAAAMDPKFKANPFRGAPKRADIPEFCGRCHSSAEYMKRFNPAIRVDQVTEYWTSKHGELLKKGDRNVPTCIDCHSVHDIRRKSQTESPVYPTHVAETCSRCHSDAKKMAEYHIPTDQYARWRVSVHANAMFNKNDLTAPTCNDCHGNHGAMPPGVDRLVFVCGNCHLREAELFRKSAKSHDWEQHNTFLATGAKCGDCHDDQRAKLEVPKFNECVTCHENHAIVRPSIAMLGPLPETPCVFCHDPSGSPEPAAAHHAQVRQELLARADQLHLSGAQRFDWLVDQAQKLPYHAHPEFVRLFEKFRIGKTHYDFDHVSVSVRRCIDCHPPADPNGRVTALDYLNTMRTVTSTTARSQRILLAAERGGVEVRKARPELDAAVDNQIELETLVHTFTPPAKAFHEKANEALGHARAALLAANTALEELAYRRRGLEIALAVIVLALIALALKIRTL